MKPGLAEIDRMPPPLPMQSECMRCHMSAVQASDTGTINRYGGLPFLHSGITCEACHGDGSKHVDSKGKGAIVNPLRLSSDQRDSICISCHLEGDVTVQRAGHSGAQLSSRRTYFDLPGLLCQCGADLTDRAVSEVEQLSQSTCKRVSGDRMSCMSCHDPHYTPDTSHRVAFFRTKCLDCHSQPYFVTSHHPENQDCTSCHMPRTGARNVLHVAWTDHRIRKKADAGTEETGITEHGDLTPIFSPIATRRDQAMANYQALMDGDTTREPLVWQQLTALRDSLTKDRAALNALGNISAERGDLEKAEEAYRNVLAIDSTDLTALSNLGVLLAKQGKLQESMGLLRRAFDRNQDIPALAKNLARVQCISGEGADARATLRRALGYCPGVEDMRALLAQIKGCVAAGTKQF